MKYFLFAILFVFCSLSFAESCSPADQKWDLCQEVSIPKVSSDSARYADSAAHYETLAARYKKDGEYLLKSSSRQAKIGGILALLGGVGFVAVLKLADNATIEGGGAVIVFPAALAMGSLGTGVIMLSINGIRNGRGNRKIQQSEEYQKTAKGYREKAWKERYRRSSELMLQIVPEIDPFNKTFGAKIALSI